MGLAEKRPGGQSQGWKQSFEDGEVKNNYRLDQKHIETEALNTSCCFIIMPE